MEKNPVPSKAYQRPGSAKLASSQKLGLHHFAYLRSIAQGLGVMESAKRHLGIPHGHAAKSAHHETVDAVRAVARRYNMAAWRLIGIAIRVEFDPSLPSLEEFIAQRGLDGWSESEITEMYGEAYPRGGQAAHRAQRRSRLRQRQLELLKNLEPLAVQAPSPTDLLAGWFDDRTAQKLTHAGLMTLSALNEKIASSRQWYAEIPGIGEHKATRIAAHLANLLPPANTPLKPVLSLLASPPLPSPSRDDTQQEFALLVRKSPNLQQVVPLPLPSPALLQARDDQEAVQAWILARAGALPTATLYRREAHRLLLWLQYERAGKSLSQMQVEDCRDYMAFLQNIPAKWISRERASPGQPGWAPFRGPLSHKSQRQTVVIVASLFTWLQSAQYLTQNPWPLINQKTGDDQAEQMLDTKALSEGAFAQIMDYLCNQAPSPSRNRIVFILRFVESVGLRSAELIGAKLGDLRLEPEGWVMQVHGKGSKNRIAAIPGQAFDALQEYLGSRHLGGMETAPPTAPLLASALDPMEPIGYQALYEHVKGWISKAVASSKLPQNERTRLAGATTHWLRHTFGTRAVAREVPMDVIQAQMGHASIQTTMSIYGRAPIKRRAEELAKAFS
jgi:integrase